MGGTSLGTVEDVVVCNVLAGKHVLYARISKAMHHESESECKCLTCNQKPTGSQFSLLHEPNLKVNGTIMHEFLDMKHSVPIRLTTYFSFTRECFWQCYRAIFTPIFTYTYNTPPKSHVSLLPSKHFERQR